MAGPVPAIPILRGAAFHIIGITGTRPGMTWEHVILDGASVTRWRQP
jgi:hypothetical protein